MPTITPGSQVVTLTMPTRYNTTLVIVCIGVVSPNRLSLSLGAADGVFIALKSAYSRIDIINNAVGPTRHIIPHTSLRLLLFCICVILVGWGVGAACTGGVCGGGIGGIVLIV